MPKKGPSPHISSSQKLHRAALWSIVLLIGSLAAVYGLRLRRQIWADTDPVRYLYDIDNAFDRGHQASEIGYLDAYDTIIDNSDGEHFGLDYAPLRLLVASQWSQYVCRHVPDAQYWGHQFYEQAEDLGGPQKAYDLTSPLLYGNLIAEGLATIAVFLLIWLWVRRDRGAENWTEVPAMALGTLGALLFWFNPAVIWNAHGWPQWDVWLIPFYLWAVYFVSVDFWFSAGLCVGVGCMFKGQILFVSPLLMLWALFGGYWSGLVRFFAGLALAIAAIASPWLVRHDGNLNPQAVHWVIEVGVAALVCGALLGLGWRFKTWPKRAALWAAAAVVALALVYWPLHGDEPHQWVVPGLNLSLTGPLVALFILLVGCCVPLRRLGHFVAFWVAAALFLCVPFFDGNMSWYKVGFEYGTRHHHILGSNAVNNLAGILEHSYDTWHDIDDTALTIDAHSLLGWPQQSIDLSLKQAVSIVFGLCLLTCSIGAALNSRRGDRRLLASISAPWVIFFAVMTQMHQRYLMWGAGITAVTVGISPLLGILSLFLSFVSWSQEATTMIVDRPAHLNDFGRSLESMLKGISPGIGWAVLLGAAILLYYAVIPEGGSAQR